MTSFESSAPAPAHVDGGSRVHFSSDAALAQPTLGTAHPAVTGPWLLWGGGATVTRQNLQLQASAWTGALSAESAGLSTAWDLRLAELALEQTYARGAVLVTAGATVDYADLGGVLKQAAGLSAVRAPLWGGGVSAGLRWPRRTPMGFFVRGAYLWMQGSGEWRGVLAPLGRMNFDLSGASVTGQVELSF